MQEKIHIGRLIQNKMQEDGRKASWLAEKTNCSKSNITRIYQNEHINSEQLIAISIHLETDFFAIYSEYVREQLQSRQQILSSK